MLPYSYNPRPSSTELAAEPSPPAPHSMPIPSLPLELIGKIISSAPTELHQKRSARDAASLCLVAKSFLPFARERLYAMDYLAFISRADGVGNPRAPGFPWPLDSCSSKLFATLVSTPHLASLVRRLHLDFEETEDPAAVHTKVAELLYACPLIEGLHLRSLRRPSWRFRPLQIHLPAQLDDQWCRRSH